MSYILSLPGYLAFRKRVRKPFLVTDDCEISNLCGRRCDLISKVIPTKRRDYMEIRWCWLCGSGCKLASLSVQYKFPSNCLSSVHLCSPSVSIYHFPFCHYVSGLAIMVSQKSSGNPYLKFLTLPNFLLRMPL